MCSFISVRQRNKSEISLRDHRGRDSGCSRESGLPGTGGWQRRHFVWRGQQAQGTQPRVQSGRSRTPRFHHDQQGRKSSSVFGNLLIKRTKEMIIIRFINYHIKQIILLYYLGVCHQRGNYVHNKFYLYFFQPITD